MLGIGFFEILVIALVCFIAIGPKQLPSVMRKFAQFYRQFIGLRDELSFQLMSASDEKKDEGKKNVEPKSHETTESIVVPREKGHG
jgi:Sec-independent protein translocase protein TatA